LPETPPPRGGFSFWRLPRGVRNELTSGDSVPGKLTTNRRHTRPRRPAGASVTATGATAGFDLLFLQTPVAVIQRDFYRGFRCTKVTRKLLDVVSE